MLEIFYSILRSQGIIRVQSTKLLSEGIIPKIEQFMKGCEDLHRCNLVVADRIERQAIELQRHLDEADRSNTDHGDQPFTSDPRAMYDAADGRFWAAELQVEGAQAFGVALNCPYKSDNPRAVPA